MIPKSNNIRIGSVNNELDLKKRKYIIEMRKALSNKNIILEDGSLNLKYFNVKKGHYWSQVENENLIKGVLKHGPTNFKKIKKDSFTNWTETEIRLRICRLLKCYNLSVYEGKVFASKEEILKEAKKNKEIGVKNKTIVGGINYNPPAETEDNPLFSMFN